MADNRGFVYSTGEDNATDAYLETVAGKRESTNAHEMSEVNGGQTWYTDAGGSGDAKYRNTCARGLVMVISAVLLLAGIGVCIFGRVEQDKKVLPLCPECKHFVTALYIFGGCLMVFALLGIGAAVTRFKPLAFLYTLLLVLLAVALIAAGFAVVIFETGLKETEVEKLWNDAVADEEQFVCQLQEKLKCSGFTKCCQTDPFTNISTSFCNATRAEIIVQCDTRCTTTNQQFTEPCNEKVEDLVKSHFKPLIGVTFGLAFLLLLVGVSSVRMTLRSR